MPATVLRTFAPNVPPLLNASLSDSTPVIASLPSGVLASVMAAIECSEWDATLLPTLSVHSLVRTPSMVPRPGTTVESM